MLAEKLEEKIFHFTYYTIKKRSSIIPPTTPQVIHVDAKSSEKSALGHANLIAKMVFEPSGSPHLLYSANISGSVSVSMALFRFFHRFRALSMGTFFVVDAY